MLQAETEFRLRQGAALEVDLNMVECITFDDGEAFTYKRVRLLCLCTLLFTDHLTHGTPVQSSLNSKNRTIVFVHEAGNAGERPACKSAIHHDYGRGRRVERQQRREGAGDVPRAPPAGRRFAHPQPHARGCPLDAAPVSSDFIGPSHALLCQAIYMNLRVDPLSFVRRPYCERFLEKVFVQS